MLMLKSKQAPYGVVVSVTQNDLIDDKTDEVINKTASVYDVLCLEMKTFDVDVNFERAVLNEGDKKHEVIFVSNKKGIVRPFPINFPKNMYVCDQNQNLVGEIATMWRETMVDKSGVKTVIRIDPK